MTRGSEAGTSMRPSRPDSSADAARLQTRYRPPLRRLGNGWRGSMTSGEMMGEMKDLKYPSTNVRSSPIRVLGSRRTMPRSASSSSSSWKARAWRAYSGGRASNTLSICSDGVRLLLLSRGWCLSVARSDRPPMRIMKNSSRLLSKMDTNLRRSNSGTDSSYASASTRSSKRSQESSRFWV